MQPRSLQYCLRLENNLLERGHVCFGHDDQAAASRTGAVMSLRSIWDSICWARKRRRSAAVGLGPGRSGICAMGVWRISSAMARDSGQVPCVPRRSSARRQRGIETGAVTSEDMPAADVRDLSHGAAAQTDVEFGQETGESDGPEAEVGDRRQPGLAGTQVFENHPHKPKKFLAGLGGREQLLGHFGEEIQRAGGGEIMRTANCESRRSQESMLTSSRFSR